MDIELNIKNNLYRLREHLRLTQESFANRVGLTQVSISHYEVGKRVPDTRSLAKIALNTGVSLDRIVFSEDCNNPIMLEVPVEVKVFNYFNRKLTYMDCMLGLDFKVRVDGSEGRFQFINGSCNNFLGEYYSEIYRFLPERAIQYSVKDRYEKMPK